MEARVFCELGHVVRPDAGIEIRLAAKKLGCSCLEIRGNRPDYAIEPRSTAIVGCIGCDLEGRLPRPFVKAKATGPYGINPHAGLSQRIHRDLLENMARQDHHVARVEKLVRRPSAVPEDGRK